MARLRGVLLHPQPQRALEDVELLAIVGPRHPVGWHRPGLLRRRDVGAPVREARGCKAKKRGGRGGGGPGRSKPRIRFDSLRTDRSRDGSALRIPLRGLQWTVDGREMLDMVHDHSAVSRPDRPSAAIFCCSGSLRLEDVTASTNSLSLRPCVAEPARLVRDEGLGGTLRIIANALRDPAARPRVIAMRRAFRRWSHVLPWPRPHESRKDDG